MFLIKDTYMIHKPESVLYYDLNVVIDMPGQRTFELIPTTIANPTSYKPPMTSKQVKRAYQNANPLKGITRAELRRIEVEELARQRREFQKERVQAKARALREAKAAKALAEVQSRKNAGILSKSDAILRSRSQTSISVFARKNCSTKRDRHNINTKAEEEDSDSWEERDKEIKQDEEPSDVKEPPTKRVAADSESSESEFDGFPFCSQLEMIVTSIDSKHDQSTSQTALVQPQTPQRSKSRNNKVRFLSPNRQIYVGNQKATVQGSVQQTAMQQVPDEHESIPKPNLPKLSEKCREKKASAKLSCLPLCLDSQNISFEECCVNRPQSPIQSENTPSSILKIPTLNDRKVVDFEATSPHKSNALLSVHTQPRKHISEDFLSCSDEETEDYLDDCLDTVDFPSNTQVMNEIKAEYSAHSDHFSTKTPENPQSSKLSVDKTEGDSTSVNQSANFDDLICTQDLVILSQELREIMSPIPLKPKSSANEKEAPVERPREKKRFFEEKEEDLLKAALYESKMMVTSINSITNTLKESMEQELDFSVPVSDTHLVTSFTPHPSISSPATDYGTDEFVGDDWEELTALC